MNDPSQSKRGIEADGCEGNRLGIKRQRIGEYSNAGKAAFYSPDSKIPRSTVLNDNMLNNDMSNDMCIDAEIPIERQGNVCFGSLCDAKVKLKIPIMVNVSKPGIWDQYQEFELFQQNGVFHLRGNESQESIGVLDIASSRILKSLYNYSGITHTVILETQALKRLACIKTKSGNLDASINILGPENLFENVGDTITKAKGYLQHPFFLQMGTKYINPHWVYPHDVRTDLRHLIGPVSANYEDTRLSMGLVDIFQSLERLEMLGITPEDPIELLNLKKSLVTPLKHYQEEGVKHILTRENHEQAASAARILQGVIGHSAFKDRLIPLYGGIDADTMGLGKTLTMLSAIVCTIQLARDFVDSRKKVEKLPVSRATLVITPSHQLIEVWSSEVRKHFTKSTLRIAVFHGSNRAKAESEIADNDIVLTTYNTLVADQKSGGLLQHIEWFRVVLDEAHYIRNNTSQQFKATCKLTATRRWCLSGTPISNSLEDLRSLLAFLRFRPFSEASFFRRHIIEPLGTDSTDQFRNLRMLMYAICFRRTADLLSLPLHLTEEVAITLSSREDEMYKKILAQSQKEYEKISTMKSSKKKHTVLFATTMQLRRLCNHGTFQQSSNTGMDSLKLDAQSKPVCEYCFADNADLGFASDTLIVCPECLRTLGHEFDAAPTYEQRSTATDSTDIALSLPHRVQTPSLSLFPSYSPSGGPMGCSTKLNVVVDNIQTTQISSKNIYFMADDPRHTTATANGILPRQGPNRASPLYRDRRGRWNPLVEEQAIGRALRIGQTRSVTIFKYITKNTVEENIVSLQKRKMHLSRISLDGRGDHAGEKLEDFMFVLQQNGSRPRNDAADILDKASSRLQLAAVAIVANKTVAEVVSVRDIEFLELEHWSALHRCYDHIERFDSTYRRSPNSPVSRVNNPTATLRLRNCNTSSTGNKPSLASSANIHAIPPFGQTTHLLSISTLCGLWKLLHFYTYLNSSVYRHFLNTMAPETTTSSLASLPLFFVGETAFLTTYALTILNSPAHASFVRMSGLALLVAITYSNEQLVAQLCLASGRPHWAATAVSLLWVQFLSASELTIVSRVQSAKLCRPGAVKGAFGRIRTGASAIGLLWNMRRIGTKWQVKNVPSSTAATRQATSRSTFILQRLFMTLIAYVVVDFVASLPPPDPVLVQPEKAALFYSLRRLNAGDLAFRAVMTISYWFTTGTLNLFMVNMGAIVAVLLNFSQPADCPPLYGAFSEAYTVRRFWGVSWHQMFRSFLTGHARLFVDNALPFLPQNSFAARYARLTTAFLISGVLHYRADQIMGVPNAENGAVIFFLLHPLCICLEDTVAPIVFAFLPKPLRRITGYLWVLVFFIWSSPVYTYPSTRLGIDTAALLPTGINYGIKRRRGTQQILRDVDGWVQPGTLTSRITANFAAVVVADGEQVVVVLESTEEMDGVVDVTCLEGAGELVV
ncbi:hypothetical protein NPX13_g1763 [Xylaria arbuscula]|uniref:Helicase ATP-binding domain-containing protein n=1 Tax=Xylaria arbuscula TaxID=114810 RepID=A0A9W8NKF0_9PEZI|nr:hypothetical protein NPX13_g1763 [Xylaria arbuscula]